MRVVIAFHRPDVDLARKQLLSILAQKDVNVSVTAVLDGAETVADEELRHLIAGTGNEAVSNAEASGVRMAFAAGLEQALVSADETTLFAYSDQDDVWHPDKLAKLSVLLRQQDAQLAYCDARVVDEQGVLLSPSLHDFESREEPHDLLEVLLLNAISGMSMVFTWRTARLALKLMATADSTLLHDHLTAVAAASLGRIVRLPEALVDYVQHDGNEIGAKPLPTHRARRWGWRPLAEYRATSAEIFRDRQAVARALAQEARLPASLGVMFLTGRRPGLPAIDYNYIAALWRLVKAKQFRRAMLCFRMFDAAFFSWLWRR